MSDRLRRVTRAYTAIALVVLNTILVFLLVNGLCLVVVLAAGYVGTRKHPGKTSPVCQFYGDTLKGMYSGYSEAEIDEILDETWSRPVLYEPYVQFRERPFRGRYVNVDGNGFRQTAGQGAWPPSPSDFTVFLFGGSTVFNYGVADADTIASRLQAQLDGHGTRPVRVYNFGRGSYYSTQERILFEKLVLLGIRPDLAIFVDGLNDFYSNADEPYFNDWFQQLFNDRSLAKPAPVPIERLPMYQVARWTKRSLLALLANPAGEPKQEGFQNAELLDRVIGRYRDNKGMIEAVAAMHGVRTLFVWQPIPTYRWDLQSHLCPKIPLNRHGYAQFGYERMSAVRDSDALGRNFVWCADIQEDLKKPVYVDDVHYSPELSERVATCVARGLASRGVLSSVRD